MKRNPVDLEPVLKMCANKIKEAGSDISAIEIAAEEYDAMATILDAYAKLLRALIKD